MPSDQAQVSVHKDLDTGTASYLRRAAFYKALRPAGNWAVVGLKIVWYLVRIAAGGGGAVLAACCFGRAFSEQMLPDAAFLHAEALYQTSMSYVPSLAEDRSTTSMLILLFAGAFLVCVYFVLLSADRLVDFVSTKIKGGFKPNAGGSVADAR